MSNQKPLLIVEDQLPKVLIIGSGRVVSTLFEYFSQNGCEVVVSNASPSAALRFDYLVQFGDIKKDKAVINHLKKDGKFLFVDTNLENDVIKTSDFKILRIGELSLWHPEILVPKIIKALFSETPKTIDLRKKPSHFTQLGRKIEKPAIPFPASQRGPIAKVIKTIPTKQPVLVKKVQLFPKNFLILFLAGVFFLFLIIAGSTSYYVYSLNNTFSRLRQDFVSSNLQQVESDVKEAREKLNVAKTILEKIPLSGDLTGLVLATDKLLRNSQEILSFSSDFQKDNFSFGGSKFSSDEIVYLKNKISSLQSSITQTSQKMEKLPLPFFPKENFLFFLRDISGKLASSDEFLPVFEKILMTDSPKIYLILFQNNMELRPTGGFIGSYGLLTLDKGRMVDFKIEDVYTADGQLKGHVDPPAPIRKYLAQPHFFLRDSNFDPDFARSANQALWFLQKETGKVVDGVIGINLFTAQKILKILGPLKVSDFNEEITADNFFYKAHLYSARDFFPGSTQKKDFLTAVANAMVSEIKSAPSSLLIELLPIVKQLLDEKNILFFSSDESLQKKIEEKGWGGRAVEVKCVGDKNDCFIDYLMAVETNLGVNKANYFVNKSVAVEKNIEADGKVTTSVILSYENTAAAEIYPDSFYTNYLRVFVPLGSKLEKVTLNNIELSTSSVDIENYAEDKTSFGLLVKIAPGNKGVVKITYTLPSSFSSSSYQLLYQKQGGDKIAPLVLSIKFPKEQNLKPVNFKPTSERENEVYYATYTSVDRIFSFTK